LTIGRNRFSQFTVELKTENMPPNLKGKMKTLNRLHVTLKLVALLVTAVLLHVFPALACTSVQLIASDGSRPYHG
jgi:hypothetical protein